MRRATSRPTIRSLSTAPWRCPAPRQILILCRQNSPRRTPADDKLITLAYTFKLLTDEQRRAIYEGLKGQEAGPAFNADIGVELPSSIELRPVPSDVAARVPQTKDYRYAVADNRVLLVAPVGRFVVGVFMDDVQAPKAGEGRRTP